MTGPIYLAVRMALYFVGASLATAGYITFDQTTGAVGFGLDGAIQMAGGLLLYGGTFLASRRAKAKGDVT